MYSGIWLLFESAKSACEVVNDLCSLGVYFSPRIEENSTVQHTLLCNPTHSHLTPGRKTKPPSTLSPLSEIPIVTRTHPSSTISILFDGTVYAEINNSWNQDTHVFECTSIEVRIPKKARATHDKAYCKNIHCSLYYIHCGVECSINLCSVREGETKNIDDCMGKRGTSMRNEASSYGCRKTEWGWTHVDMSLSYCGMLVRTRYHHFVKHAHKKTQQLKAH
jgi:hypothetical protein